MSVRTIRLQGQRNLKELVAAGAIKPGMLLAISTTGTVAAHAVAGKMQRRLFASENELIGKTVDDAYASGERVRGDLFAPNEVVGALLKKGFAYTPATALVSDGTGMLQPVTALASAAQAAAEIVGYPQSALDLSAGGAVDTLHPVDVL